MSKKVPSNQSLLTVRQLAERWGISVHTLNGWRSKGRGPEYIKLGGVRYPLESVVAYEAGGLRQAPAASSAA